MTTTQLLATASRTGRLTRLSREMPASPEAVWAAWTDPAILPAWFGPLLEGQPGPGQTYVLEGRGQHGDTITCTVLDWEPPNLLRHRWTYTGEPDSVFRLELRPLGEDGTTLLIEHSEFGPEVDAADYAAGWHMYTDNLEAYLVGDPSTGDSDGRWRELYAAYAAAAV